MTKYFMYTVAILAGFNTSAQKIGIGKSNPQYMLDVASHIRTDSSLYVNSRVGIGTTNPAYRLDVNGTSNFNADVLVGGYVGIGTTTPSYKLTVQDGSLAIYNSTDVKTWTVNYNSGGNFFAISEGGVVRMAIANGGNVGIGTSSPTEKLHVAGDIKAEAMVTVDNGKGIVRSWNSSQQKYYTQKSSVTAILAAFGTSAEFSIAWPSSLFTKPPVVMVADITSTGGTSGQLWRVQMITYSTTTNSCKARLINTHNGPVNYDVTWNVVLIGE